MESNNSIPTKIEVLNEGIPSNRVNRYFEEYEQFLKLSIHFFYLYVDIRLKKDLSQKEIEKLNKLIEFKKTYLVPSFYSGKIDNATEKSKLNIVGPVFMVEYINFLLELKNDESYLQNLYNKMNGLNKDMQGLNKILVSHHTSFIKHIELLFEYLQEVEQNIIYTDKVIDEEVKIQYVSSSKRDLTKVSNVKYLERGIFEEALYRKTKIFLSTLDAVKKDLKKILETDEFSSSKDDVMSEFIAYYNDIVYELHLKGDGDLKIKTWKSFFTLLETNEMNWLREENFQVYYTHIYDILMFKYRLYAAFKTYDFFKKTDNSLDELLENGKLHTIEGSEQYVFLYRHIKSIRDINGILIKMFEGDSQSLIKTILNVRTRTDYSLITIKVFPQIIELLNKSKTIETYLLYYKNLY